MIQRKWLSYSLEGFLQHFMRFEKEDAKSPSADICSALTVKNVLCQESKHDDSQSHMGCAEALTYASCIKRLAL